MHFCHWVLNLHCLYARGIMSARMRVDLQDERRRGGEGVVPVSRERTERRRVSTVHFRTRFHSAEPRAFGAEPQKFDCAQNDPYGVRADAAETQTAATSRSRPVFETPPPPPTSETAAVFPRENSHLHKAKKFIPCTIIGVFLM